MLDWPEALVLGVCILFVVALLTGVCIGVWRLVLYIEWRCGDHKRWAKEILNFLAERRATGAEVRPSPHALRRRRRAAAGSVRRACREALVMHRPRI